jgi:hypothetical protein
MSQNNETTALVSTKAPVVAPRRDYEGDEAQQVKTIRTTQLKRNQMVAAKRWPIGADGKAIKTKVVSKLKFLGAGYSFGQWFADGEHPRLKNSTAHYWFEGSNGTILEAEVERGALGGALKLNGERLTFSVLSLNEEQAATGTVLSVQHGESDPVPTTLAEVQAVIDAAGGGNLPEANANGEVLLLTHEPELEMAGAVELEKMPEAVRAVRASRKRK